MDRKRKKSQQDDPVPPAKLKILTIDQVNEGKGVRVVTDGHESSSSDPDGERSATPLVPIRSIRNSVPASDRVSNDDVSQPSKNQESLWDAILKQIQSISEEESNRAGEGQVPSKTQVQRYLGSCLRTATKRNLVDIIKKLIEEKKVDPNDKDTVGTTSVMIAAAQGHVDVLEFLLTISDLSLVDKNQLTVLHHAVKKNDERSVRLLLSANFQVDINARTKRGMTPLMIACTEGCEAVVKALLSYPKLDVNMADNSEDTALLNACSKGNEAIVSLLLDHKDLQVNKANSNMDTALMIASNEEHPGVVRLLLNREDIDVNAQNSDKYTALMCGCDKGNVEIVRSLLDHDETDINLEDSNQETALIWACDKDQPKVISLLLQREELDRSASNLESIMHVVMKRRVDKKDLGAVIEEALFRNLPDIAVWLLKEKGSWYPEPGFLQGLLAIAAQECHVNVVEYLLDNQLANVNILDVNKNTALMLAANIDNKDEESYALVQLLIKKGADVDIQGKEGNTAMMLCCDKDRLDLVNLLLLNSSVDVNIAGRDLFTPLIIAARGDKEDMVRALLNDANIDVNKKGHEGKSALVNAAEQGFHNIVRILLEFPGIDINSIDGGGYTALMWGADMGHPSVVRELMKYERLDPNIKDLDGHTALTWAADRGHEEVVKMLLSLDGIEINPKDVDGYNPFLCAAKKTIGVVKVLAEDDRTDVNVQDDASGATALHSAVERDLFDIVEYLLGHPRVIKDLKNKKGKTAEKLALDRSKKIKSKKIHELFRKFS